MIATEIMRVEYLWEMDYKKDVNSDFLLAVQTRVGEVELTSTGCDAELPRVGVGLFCMIFILAARVRVPPVLLEVLGVSRF